MPAEAAAPGLSEAARLHWRADASERGLRRDELLWTVWTMWIAIVFVAPGALLIVIEPLTLPAAAICFAHAWAIPWLQARRGARQLIAIGSSRSVASPGANDGAERVALGLLGDLVDHRARDLLETSGLVLERGELGAWLVGERGALLVRRGGRRVDCWCVRVGALEGLPAGDRVAHLLLALREDELGFVKVANLGFSGARWRVARELDQRSRPALGAARAGASLRAHRPSRRVGELRCDDPSARRLRATLPSIPLSSARPSSIESASSKVTPGRSTSTRPRKRRAPRS